jgi:PIN domain nuclease of toxin-antitoxin system
VGKRPTHIVDASALIAYLKQESGSQVFADLLAVAENTLAIHSVNLCEVYYTFLRVGEPESAENAWKIVESILSVIEKTDEQFMKRVGRWKAKYATFPLGDAFAAATAEEFACPLVTADHHDFDQAEKDGSLKIVWVR